MFKDKTLLITGGTGSFGNAVLRRFLNTDFFSEIRIFSRDEKKQDDMRQFYRDDKIKYYIGNVRDKRSVDGVSVKYYCTENVLEPISFSQLQFTDLELKLMGNYN